MNFRHYYVDTSVFAYALGGSHPERAGAQRVVEAATTGRIVLHASVQMVQELVHHRMRRAARETALRQARYAGQLCILYPFDATVLQHALNLIEGSALWGRDAVHGATALINGVPTLLSSDPDFDAVPGATRLAPSDFR